MKFSSGQGHQKINGIYARLYIKYNDKVNNNNNKMLEFQ